MSASTRNANNTLDVPRNLPANGVLRRRAFGRRWSAAAARDSSNSPTYPVGYRRMISWPHTISLSTHLPAAPPPPSTNLHLTLHLTASHTSFPSRLTYLTLPFLSEPYPSSRNAIVTTAERPGMAGAWREAVIVGRCVLTKVA
jgi:hypothetical protein